MSLSRRYFDLIKRTADVLLSASAIVLTAPLQLLIALFVLVTHGRPVLFRQQRPGKNGKIFELIKFRTMLHPDTNRVSDEDRMTKAGQFLRSTSLDELPSLFNVLRGDMSLIGPRPLLPEYLDLYTDEQARRHEVRPGITGLAQVSGRNSLSWDERFRLDVDYVDHRSVGVDFRIVKATIKSVLNREGISQDGHVTMEPFRGSGLEETS